jgi:hypothetical protein
MSDSMYPCKKCGVEDDVHDCDLCKSSFCGDCNVRSGWFRLDPDCSYGLYGCFLCKPDFESAKEVNLKCVENGWVHKKNWCGEDEELDEKDIEKAMQELKRRTPKAEEAALRQEKKGRLADKACVQGFEDTSGDKASQMGSGVERSEPGYIL